jgi:hypothetical protein
MHTDSQWKARKKFTKQAEVTCKQEWLYSSLTKQTSSQNYWEDIKKSTTY